MKIVTEDWFLGQVEKDDLTGCWIWTGLTTGGGYGHFYSDDRHIGAHQWAHEHWIGPIPHAHEVDHLCYNPACVNPEHLQAVTPELNRLRALWRRKAM